MAELTLTWHSLHKAEMEYHGSFRHTIERIQHIAIMSRIDLCYATFHLATQTVVSNLPGFKGINRCFHYLASHPHKPRFYPSNYYDGWNVIRLTCSGNQVEDHTNCLECHQYADHAIFINIRRSVSGIIHTLLGFAVCWKVQIQATIASESPYGEIRWMYKSIKKKKVSWDTCKS